MSIPTAAPGQAFDSAGNEIELSLDFRQFLEEYTGIPLDNQLQHVSQVRESYPDSFGNLPAESFRLLDYSIRQHPRYSYLLGQLRTVSNFNPPALLIVGTTFGQDLRYLLHDGIPNSKLYAYFLRPGLFDASTALFGDADTFPPIHSVRADALSGETTSPLYLTTGSWTAINTNGYLNRFDLMMQEQVAYTMLSLLRQEEGSTLLGSVLGDRVENVPAASLFPTADIATPNLLLPIDVPGTPYRHTSVSLRALWQRVQQQSGLELFIEVEEAPVDTFGDLGNPLATRIFFFIEIQSSHQQSEWRVFG